MQVIEPHPPECGAKCNLAGGGASQHLLLHRETCPTVLATLACWTINKIKVYLLVLVCMHIVGCVCVCVRACVCVCVCVRACAHVCES